MLFSKIDKLGEPHVRIAEVKKVVTSKTYNGASRGADGKGWSLTDMITQQGIASAAVDGLSHISGMTRRGKRLPVRPIINSLNIKLKVLTRQACFTDKNGDRIEIDPTEDEMVVEGVKPVKGDKVRVRGNQIITNDDGTALSFQEREYMTDNNIPMYEFEDVEVDGDLCITVGCDQAMQLLRTNGYKIRKPQYKKSHTSIKNKKEAIKRRITNWLFEEVAADYTTKKPRAPKAEPKQEVAQGADK